MGVPDDLLAKLHPLEVKLLPHLRDDLLTNIAKNADLQEVEAMRACQWLENKQALTLELHTTHELSLGENGESALNGLPEERFLNALNNGAKTRDQILKKGDLDNQEYGACIGILKRESLIEMSKDKITLTDAGKKKQFTDTQSLLNKLKNSVLQESLNNDELKVLDNLKKRKEFVVTKERRDRKIKLTELGKQLSKVDTKKLQFDEKLTKEDLESGKWKDKKYRAYDVTVPVPKLHGGRKHFVQEALEYIHRIWLEMGFTEMEGPFVATSFWTLDTLFVPQDHPARETQDTFYLQHPEFGIIEKPAFERVRDVHEHGANTGSIGWRYRFSLKESERLIMRTHTTLLSAQTLWKIRNGEANLPGKYFSVGKVFRNEKLDWKHLFEFTQIEGIVVDKKVTFAQLIGFLTIFFQKMGFPKVRLRPHHFPYTEPSVEVDVWNPRKNQWVELGGAGVFRPEVSKTLIGEETPVLAWGLGLERIIVEYFDLQDLRDLYRNDIKQIQEMKRFFKVTHG